MYKSVNTSRIISGATISDNENIMDEFLEFPHLIQNFSPKEILGKRGLLFKDRATLYALCAVQNAIKASGLDFSDENIKNGTGVVVSSNLGNVDTICETIEVINEENSNSLSALNTPRASSNVIASNIAIKHNLRGPNITLCNGSSSGTDAIRIANNLLNSNRAERVVVVGVEIVNEYVLSLWEHNFQENDTYFELVECAACVILESLDTKHLLKNSQPIVTNVQTGKLEDMESHINAIVKHQTVHWFIPNTNLEGINNRIRIVKERLNKRKRNIVFNDLSIRAGDPYGAYGVLQCVMGAEIIRQNKGNYIFASSGGNWGDNLSTLTLGKE